MFDIGFPELVLIAIVGLLVIGPERLPEALRTLGLWLGRMRRSFTSVKNEIEKEIGMDEVRRQLHNEAVMEEMKRIEQEVRHGRADDAADTEGHGDAAEVAKEDEPPYIPPAVVPDPGPVVETDTAGPSGGEQNLDSREDDDGKTGTEPDDAPRERQSN